jgi:hypothetical protein
MAHQLAGAGPGAKIGVRFTLGIAVHARTSHQLCFEPEIDTDKSSGIT